MIIRILGQGQFEVKSSLFDDLNAIDNRIVECVRTGDEAGFRAGLAELTGVVIRAGVPLPDEEIVASAAVIPPADLTLKEAAAIFTGEGIFAG